MSSSPILPISGPASGQNRRNQISDSEKPDGSFANVLNDLEDSSPDLGDDSTPEIAPNSDADLQAPETGLLALPHLVSPPVPPPELLQAGDLAGANLGAAEPVLNLASRLVSATNETANPIELGAGLSDEALAGEVDSDRTTTEAAPSDLLATNAKDVLATEQAGGTPNAARNATSASAPTGLPFQSQPIEATTNTDAFEVEIASEIEPENVDESGSNFTDAESNSGSGQSSEFGTSADGETPDGLNSNAVAESTTNAASGFTPETSAPDTSAVENGSAPVVDNQASTEAPVISASDLVHQNGPANGTNQTTVNSINAPSSASQFSMASASPATQVAAVFSSGLTSFENEPIQTVTVELHPAELGQIKITVERVSDQLMAQIVATESNAAEMLLHEKDFLHEALADLGFGETSVDIRQGGRENDEPQQDRNSYSAAGSTEDADESARPKTTTQSSTGINLVA